MNNKNALTSVFTLIAIILGVTLFKKFDFETWTFEKPALAIVYSIALFISIYILIKQSRKLPNK